MNHSDVIVIGAGQAGLALSHCLSERNIEHLVLERGRVAERWKSERWDSLRLLTPNWQSRLPGYRYSGPDPDGYMNAAETSRYLEGYARACAAPIQTQTEVLRVTPCDLGYRVETNRGVYHTANLVIATGHCDVAKRPSFASRLAPRLTSLVPSEYRNPEQLPPGGVLVVGASASGVQIADEIQASGRQVTLAVGAHTRLPRVYREHDIMFWLDRMGVLSEPIDPERDVTRARSEPSLQLVGRPDRSSLDLPLLQQRGVRLAGQALGGEGESVAFADDLQLSTSRADAKLRGLLDRVDRFIDSSAARVRLPGPSRPEAFVPRPGVTRLDLCEAGICSVLYATGFSRSYPWLKLPVLDQRGEIRQRGGVTALPGLYVLGLHFLRRRNSNFIDGVGDDARYLSRHIAARLGHVSAAA